METFLPPIIGKEMSYILAIIITNRKDNKRSFSNQKELFLWLKQIPKNTVITFPPEIY